MIVEWHPRVTAGAEAWPLFARGPAVTAAAEVPEVAALEVDSCSERWSRARTARLHAGRIA